MMRKTCIRPGLMSSRLQMPMIILSWLLLTLLTVPIGVTSFLTPHHHNEPVVLARHKEGVGYNRFSQNESPEGKGFSSRLSQASPPSATTLVVTSLHHHNEKLQDSNSNSNHNHNNNKKDDETPKLSRRKALVRRSKRFLRRIRKPLIPIAASLVFWMSARVPPAQAKMANEATETPTYSLRPGMSSSDIEDVMSGKSEITDHDPSGVATTSPTKKDAADKKESSSSIYGSADLDDEDDDFDLDADDYDAFATRKVATKADQQRAMTMQASQSSQFAGFQKEKSTMMYVKVGAGLFLPTFGTMFVREHFRQRKEEAYVQKGLEILEAQKAEYFNVTSTSEDSDLEDELKGLKNNSTDTDDDEDDDDDSEDDDEDDRPRRSPKRPKGPAGGGGGGGGGDDDDDDDSGGSGSGFDPGYGEASDEDRDRLKDLFNKS